VKACRVVGPLWATVKHPAYAGHPLFVVQPIDERGHDIGTSFVAIDHVQAGAGDTVLVLTEGNGARQILKQGDIVPIRSVIVGIVDHIEVERGAPA
jgi:microcompartment protein CcmK/EutM